MEHKVKANVFRECCNCQYGMGDGMVGIHDSYNDYIRLSGLFIYLFI
jgi:hypothetical protein